MHTMHFMLFQTLLHTLIIIFDLNPSSWLTSFPISLTGHQHSPEDEDKVLFLGLLGLERGVIEGIAAVVAGEHVDELGVRIALIALQDLTALLHDNLLLVAAQAEENHLLPLLLLVLAEVGLAHLHVVEEVEHILVDFNPRCLTQRHTTAR